MRYKKKNGKNKRKEKPLSMLYMFTKGCQCKSEKEMSKCDKQ